jgi:sigma-B regulation protein RsbU (phosphoserine phosphatase)
MATALLMSATRSLFRTAAEGSSSLSEVLTGLNKSGVKDLPSRRFVTLLYLILDAEHATAKLANAGHPYPLCLSVQSGVAELRTNNGLLGLMDSVYPEVEIERRQGDRALMYTDGLVEATNSMAEELGISRLQQALAKPNVSAQSVLDDVHLFAHSGTLVDDATAILLK